MKQETGFQAKLTTVLDDPLALKILDFGSPLLLFQNLYCSDSCQYALVLLNAQTAQYQPTTTYYPRPKKPPTLGQYELTHQIKPKNALFIRPNSSK